MALTKHEREVAAKAAWHWPKGNPVSWETTDGKL